MPLEDYAIADAIDYNSSDSGKNQNERAKQFCNRSRRYLLKEQQLTNGIRAERSLMQVGKNGI